MLPFQNMAVLVNNGLDLSTGINPSSYTIPKIPKHFWNSLPDSKAQKELLIQAGEFWDVPNNSDIMAASGVSQLIAVLPNLLPVNRVRIISPTYNEHAAAFRSNGWEVGDAGNVQVIVNPNNPDGTIIRFLKKIQKISNLI